MNEENIKTFHIVWFDDATKIWSTGKNYNDLDEIGAIAQWKDEFPFGVFHSMSVK